MKNAVGSSSVSDATTIGGSTEGLAPKTSCMSSKYCPVAAATSPASVSDSVKGVHKS